MNMIKVTKEKIALTAIVILSALLNFVNLGIEGYSNQYYAAAVKSMTLSLKNFFFVSLDPAGFVTVDKPPFGYWMQAISAKIFGFSGWSILLPQALAGVLSVVLIYYIVKRSFGIAAGLISALCLAITPVFVAVSRNNTVDNQLVFVLLLACWALSIAAEKGKLKYLIISMIFIGLGFTIKMLQAYMILPAVYTLYLFSSAVSVKKRIAHLMVGTAVLLAVSLSWALVVDAIPAANRPYVGSSGNNTVMGLVTGHNGTERLGGIFNLFSRSGSPGGSPGRGPGGGAPPNRTDDKAPGNSTSSNAESKLAYATGSSNQQPADSTGYYNTAATNQTGQGMPSPGTPPAGNGGDPRPGGNNMQPPAGDGPGGGGPGGGSGGGLSGTFGNQTPAGITRLFAKNVLSDQIVWFIPLALLGFLAAACRERLRFRLDNKRKQALVLWFMWFLPEFIYFSYNTGLFHSYYLTMMAPPIAALAGIGIASMWEMYKEGGWKSWFLPLALLANGAVQLLMLSYFYSSSSIVKVLMVLLIGLCFVSTLALVTINLMSKKKPAIEGELENMQSNKMNKLNKALVSLAIAGLLVAPAAGSCAAMFYAVNSSFPGAGLELLPAQLTASQKTDSIKDSNRNGTGQNGVQHDSTADLIAFLNNHQVNGKSQIVVSSANTAENLTLKSDVYVGSLSGFMGNETVMSLDRFKQLVKNGEVRYVLADRNDGRGGSNSEIMTWVKKTGQLVSYAGTDAAQDSNSQNSEQVYDLIGYTEGTTSE
ncbi:MAG TPA: glycosyltransferase family 39 protein [Syntrophomonadaceae bacterium]|nr:glycosyltransferase family 39 protein [Syntrophomonadaceae bacterium]